jgi:hypothetical protein
MLDLAGLFLSTPMLDLAEAFWLALILGCLQGLADLDFEGCVPSLYCG